MSFSFRLFFLFKRKFNFFFFFVNFWILKFWSKFITFFILKILYRRLFPKKNISRKWRRKKKRFWVLDIWWDFLLCKWNLLKKKKGAIRKFNTTCWWNVFIFFFFFLYSELFLFVRLLNICFLFLTQAKKINVWENIFYIYFVWFCFNVFFLFTYNFIGEIPGNAITFYINFLYTIDKLECHHGIRIWNILFRFY